MANTLDLVRATVTKGQPFTLDQLMANQKITKAVGGDRKKVHMAIYGQLRKQEQAGTPAAQCDWVKKDDETYIYNGDPKPARATRARKATKTAKRGNGMATPREKRAATRPARQPLADTPLGWAEVGTDAHGHQLVVNGGGVLYVAIPWTEHQDAN